jgi:hypothetical protein
MRLDARLAGQWTPAELGVHPVAGGGPLPAYVRRPHDERLRVILAYHSNETNTGGAVSYRYGCEPDLTPAPPWRWAPPGPPAAGSGPAR